MSLAFVIYHIVCSLLCYPIMYDSRTWLFPQEKLNRKVMLLSEYLTLDWLCPCPDKSVTDDVEKSAAQFEALDKGEPSPEKEMIKARDPLSKVCLDVTRSWICSYCNKLLKYWILKSLFWIRTWSLWVQTACSPIPPKFSQTKPEQTSG